MQQRRITLDDGRYLIFYTFEDEGAQAESSARDESREGAAQESPEAEPQAEEERRV
jgi:hypothetical protein